tara:strand:- start:5829 stop:6503 length:675 start_codon:yes stop_codon:yes gene_type:complete
VIEKPQDCDDFLLVFCKQPRLNQGKQRIAATLGAEKTLDIASALLNCALEDASNWEGTVVLSPAAEDEKYWAEGLLPEARVYVQPQGKLGRRIMDVDQKIRDQGRQKVIIIGTDAPILNRDMYQQALDALDHSDVVFSSASDGGVTLMGSNLPWPDIEGLSWSTEHLGAELNQACLLADRTISYIPPSYDIDHEVDLDKLLTDLEFDPRPSRKELKRVIGNVLN